MPTFTGNTQEMQNIENYINGELCEPEAGEFLKNHNPATGKVYSLTPDSGTADVERAVSAARTAFPAWSGLLREKRSKFLLRISDLILERSVELVRAESIDNGKPFVLAQKIDIPRAAENFKFCATAILHSSSEMHDTDGNFLNYTLRRPIGVIGCISPWNLPLYLFSWKIAPALAAGMRSVSSRSLRTCAFRWTAHGCICSG